MKRLIIVASLAILAVGCQKTFVQNEVQTPIGFSTEVGKQTRAIVDGTTYDTNQPFGVYAYGHQAETNKTNTIMANVEVFYDDENDDKWRASDGITYYWPNDPRTKINFYAYSPAQSATDYAKHQELTGTVSHNETDGFTLTDYEHSNMYVDFMVGRPVLEATFSDQDGSNGEAASLSSVPVSFNHQMTQIVFNVKTNKPYGANTQTTNDDVTFTVQSITLNNINNTANYVHTSTPSYTDTQTKFTHGVWGGHAGTVSYPIFPAVKLSNQNVNGNPDINADEAAKTVNHETTWTTTPVTMIPQTLVTNTDHNQSFTIVYTIEGKGVATETVSKTVDLNNGSHTAWAINQKITYNVVIGLNEITFSPSVATWSTDTDVPVDITPVVPTPPAGNN